MQQTRVHRASFQLHLVSVVLFLLLCSIARVTGNFHLRLVVEGASEALIIFSVAWCWLNIQPLPWRALIGLAVIATTLGGTYWVLQSNFPSWFESVIWVLPLVSILMVVAKNLGGLSQHISKRSNSQFSLRAILALTTAIAVFLPLVNGLVRLRGSQAFGQWIWLADAMVLAVPLSLLCTTAILVTLLGRNVYSVLILVTSPAVGFAICRIYNWGFYQSMILPITTACAIALLLALAARNLTGIGIQNPNERSQN